MKRILIEKKDDFNVEAKELYKDFKEYLKLEGLKAVRVVNAYELFGATDEEVEEIVNAVLYEPQLDYIYEDMPPIGEDEKAFRVQTVSGQYNQREDMANNLVKNYLGYEHIDLVHSKYIILKNISQEELEKAKSYYINPTESKEIPLDYSKLQREEDVDDEVEIVEGFIELDKAGLEKLIKIQGIGLDLEDLLYVQKYFKEEEKRNPTVTELKIIDTYWSDHCRHKTFNTEITDIEIDEGSLKKVFEEAIKEYLASRHYVYGETSRPVSLMDLATINMKEIKKKGLLDDKEETDEINAASIEVEVDHAGKTEKWLLMFKNETHNHPTEIEPFGGAATCLGGGIRDPLSGRSYVYQAMRITGASDPRQSFEDTIPGKLPQRNITQKAMEGYSSYGYQIGSPAGYIQEFYHEGFVAKRMEIGALVAAAPKDWVVRKKPEPTDLVLLIGGRTGRDGIGAAVGSSKEHTEEALIQSGAEVQKGNPILERKIVRLFRNPEATRLIKKCNDFGAGGVSVAVGELADGLKIDLDKVSLKYPGLKDWEVALAESQERMAVVIDKKDLDKFMKLVEEEDLEGSVIAEVTDNKRLVMTWRGKTVANISTEFLDSAGIRKKTRVRIISPQGMYLKEDPNHIKGEDIKKDFIENMTNLNTASQKGLIERFDHTNGSGAVLMPLGGKYRLTPQEGMVAKLPVLDGKTTTCSIMTCGYDPYLSSWSTFHGGYYAVIESIAKVVALGGDFRKIRLSFQEYFERLEDDPTKWAKPFTALLGAFLVQKNLDIPSIGGKDSMSGTFEDIDVPPTLVSFAVTTEDVNNIVSREFKKANSQVVVIKLNMDQNGLVDFEELKKNYTKVKELINQGVVLASSTVKHGGIARSISEMAFGNRIGFQFNTEILDRIYKPLYGSIILEIEEGKDLERLLDGLDYSIVGRTMEDEEIRIGKETISLDELIEKWQEPLKDVFPIEEDSKVHTEHIYYEKGVKTSKFSSIARPKVLIPVFTGTHGEYDLELKFKEAGAEVDTFVFKSLSRDKVRESVRELAKRIKDCQILALANGFILGNEPESGGKMLKLIFRESELKEAVNELLSARDGLVLGIGAGVHALIKLGLIEKGYITDSDDTSTYIAHNRSGKFISTIVDVKVVSNLSPWMAGMKVGDVYSVPVSTNEGRIILAKEDIKERGQIASQFVDINPTGSDLGIEALTSPDGRVLGTVSSIDRIGRDIYKNTDIKGYHNIFESGVKYFK
ncbi:MAG: phosphoribosylformylglycinamidine synthase [Tissierellia bacterium]|nr:phosphoribosylformylglycinamidine synthase [Tissierellia bacterium]